MALSGDTRDEQKLKAIRRAQKRLAQRLDMIDWEHDVLLKEVQALKAGKPVLGIDAGMAFEIEVLDANHSPAAPNSGDSQGGSHRVDAPAAEGQAAGDEDS